MHSDIIVARRVKENDFSVSQFLVKMDCSV